MSGSADTLDFAEAYAPPMLNYGWVYPQALLVFTLTLVYSVVSPLILVFGAIYFGVACEYADGVVWVRLIAQIWCTSTSSCSVRDVQGFADGSLLQAIRVQWRSLGNHLLPPALRSPHLPGVHGGSALAQGIVLALCCASSFDIVYPVVELWSLQGLWTAQHVSRFEQYL
jgi:hypothetical protein